MKSRRRRGGGVGSWHSEDGVHLGVPPTRYGAPPAAADGAGRLPRCQSSEDVSSGRRASGDAASRCRRTQFRLRPLAPASSVGQLDRLQGGRPDRLQGDRPAAGAAAAAEPAAGGGDAQPWARGSAEERRRLFQRRRARWEPEPAARQAAAPGPGPTVERQDVTTAANCVGLSTKGGGEGLAKHPAGQNGAAPEPGGTVGVSVLLQSWMERLEWLSLQQRREEMEGSTTAVDGEAAGDEPSDPPSAPATPPTPTGDWVPTFVVSDCSGRSWPAPWSELLASGGGGGGRRLSAVSDCSTVSSAGWDRSRRGSLLDLDTQGLRLDDDGRLERAATHHGSETEPRDGPAATNGQLGTEIDLGTIPGPEDGLGTTSGLEDGLRTISGLEDGLGTTSGLEDGLGTISGPGDGRRRSAETSRKISSWSYSSVSTLSQDEEEEPRTAGPTPGASSQWRKVKGVVQWTPFVQTYKKQKYLWVQLAGHQGNFRAGRDGTIQKRLCGREQQCLQELMDDSLRPFVPEYRGQTESEDGQQFLQLQDLLAGFVEPCVMDCKIGVRTYLEEELAKAKVNPKLRKDMYDKMMAVDKTAPTEEEHRLKAVTKPRYMVWRETISSTASLGFRIEGIRKSRGYSSKDFKTTRSEGQIRAAIAMFTDGYPNVVTQYLARLDEILAALHGSEFFRKHEFIGSSLLFVHDANRAGVWLIDFAKTTPLPAGARVSHRAPWRPGSHEDGYLTGAENLRRILAEMAGRGAAP